MAYLIKSRRVNLRSLRKSDADSIYRYARDRENSRWTLIPYPYKLMHAHEFITIAKSAARKKVPQAIILGIEHKETGAIVGAIGFHRLDSRMKSAEVGCWIGRPFRRQGLMTEAMVVLLRYAFMHLKLKRVYAHIFVENAASQRMVERCGFKREGCLRASHHHHKRWRSSYLYAILKEEFPKAQGAARL